MKNISTGIFASCYRVSDNFTSLNLYQTASVCVLSSYRLVNFSCVRIFLTHDDGIQRQRGRGWEAAPTEKLASWAAAWAGLLPVLRMHAQSERSYSTRTTMKQTNFPGSLASRIFIQSIFF